MKYIPRQEWTIEIQRVALEIQYRAAKYATPCQERDISAFGDGETVYVLGNPCVSEWDVLDDRGEPTGETIKEYNIRGEYAPGTLLLGFDNGKASIPIPRIVVLRPDLCFRLRDGKVTDGGDFHSDRICAGLQEQLASEIRESWRTTADMVFSAFLQRG